MEGIEEIKKEISLIKERNQRVELDKAWETSIFRIVFVLIMTYIITAVVFYFIGVNNFLLNALIPTVGFYLSTQSLPFIKQWWIDKFYR
ncbi:MAG: hypothetical protein A2904_01965 [Candidatus Staskawiczbacteria bacterium RIFCSPLOWO2_01_FULL_33_9]|uniref:2TM domain-containing protein n=1 Tax=Candidatus Staskawiczbacteria bacterium RIFCSPLOWO2_01_FULL_33_9 TaxID=1802211 RepID=A0A1G2I721_9BACT|nr:MAG: hypothetical protein A2904_01965 [Candidatus Staskawiczbacteria bacterium RIFCSPLOWO2_01_FULL_33_9]